MRKSIANIDLRQLQLDLGIAYVEYGCNIRIMKVDKTGLRVFSRVVWSGLFLSVSAAFAWLEWRSGASSAMGWFLVTSLWSALCGIGFTVSEWWIGNQDSKTGCGALRRHGHGQDR